MNKKWGYSAVLLVILLIILIFFLNNRDNYSIRNDNYECSTDSECAPAGCSGQICASGEKAKEIITTCEYKEEYSCLKLTSCGCVNNKCAWKENENYLNCLEGVRV